MANDCLYEMKIKGTKDYIKKILGYLNAEYDYSEGKPENKHFCRIFDCYDESGYKYVDTGVYEKYVWGYCAWSVSSCMLESGYYSDLKKSYGDNSMAITLNEASIGGEIEVFSEEPGMAFSEHYIYKNGKCLLDNCVEINFKNTENDYTILNPHRECLTEEFKFTI